MPQKSKKTGSVISIVFLLAILFLAYLFLEPSREVPVQLPPTATVAGATTQDNAPENIVVGNTFPIYFTDPVLPYDGRKSGGIEGNLMKMIDGAKTSIDLAVFEFDLEDVAQSLIRADKRGVKVRVVHDDEHTKSDPQIGELQEAGIEIVPDDRSAYMHNKFFIIDAYCVWTGSFNLSVNAAFKNNENAVVICDDKLAKNYSTEFQEMFEGGFGPKSPANTPYPSLTVDGIQIENYFAPEDEVMDQVIRSVSEAKKSIRFMAFSFTDDVLANEMVKLRRNGLAVTGIFEGRGASGTGSSCPDLLKSGADIALDGNKYTFHHKVIIVDGEMVIFGSFNFSANANEQNDENLLIVHDRNFAQKFENEFQKRWSESNRNINSDCTSK